MGANFKITGPGPRGPSRRTLGARIRHRISGQHGVLVSRGIWYAAVKFDGEDGTSCVAVDSVVAVDEADYGCETCAHESHPSGPCPCGCDD